MTQLTTENVNESLTTLTYTRQVHVNAHTHTATAAYTHTYTQSTAEHGTAQIQTQETNTRMSTRKRYFSYTEGMDSGFLRRCMYIQVAYRNVHTDRPNDTTQKTNRATTTTRTTRRLRYKQSSTLSTFPSLTSAE